MNLQLLKKHVDIYTKRYQKESESYKQDLAERQDRTKYYQSWNKERLATIDESELYEYFGKLWAMLIWGNKQYVVNKLIQDNGLNTLRNSLIDLLWGSEQIPARWDKLRKTIKGMGPAMMSEILCHVHPDDYMIWNRRAYVALNYLGFKNLPRYNYQFTGTKYQELSNSAKTIAEELAKAGMRAPSLLTVDYFMWDELQVEDNLSQIYSKKSPKEITSIESEDSETKDFIHDEIRDKIAEIGTWLGFATQIETKIAEGSKVDAVWEATIGNMGRVIYVFEVQTKGSIDSLILNLLKALNNPAVQGVVAVSDLNQLDKIKKHASNVGDLGRKLKYWDYSEVLDNHEALSAVNESINRLGLVPQGF